MFYFEKYPVYQTSQKVYTEISSNVLSIKKISPSLKEQLRRSSLSIILNIAEGSARYTKKDKSNFFITARGSANESAAILNIIKLQGKLEEKIYSDIYTDLETIAKMLTGLIKSLSVVEVAS